MDKATEILKKLSLEEKAALVIGETAWTTTPVEHAGLPSMRVSDGPHGVRMVAHPETMDETSVPATCFPTYALLAASWDPDLANRMGKAIAEEATEYGVDVMLGPGNNMKRSPLCGRNFEYFSEDPYLAGEMAVGIISGIQSKGIGTSLKHFAVNNQEFQRFIVDALVDERTLREIYLPAFEKAVKEAKPWTVMCSYNKLNGTANSQNSYLLTDILKKEWGFEGLVVSDWGAVTDRVKGVEAGLDLEMPGPRASHAKQIVEAVNSGALSEAKLDECALRIIKVVLKAHETKKGAAYNKEAHHSLAREIAGEGMVLLKNNGLLPLKGQKKLAVIGHSAKEAYFQGGGSSNINSTKVDHPLEEIKKLASGMDVLFAEGYTADGSENASLFGEAVAAAHSADAALIFVAPPTLKETEGSDRSDMDLSAPQIALIKAVSAIQPNTVVILNNSSAMAMSEWIDGTAAVLEAYMMGQAGAGAIADILFGKVNPSGKLAETFPLRLSDTPAYINFPGENKSVRYGEGLFIGYRYYDYCDKSVLFPFGHGLSYTTFKYSNAKLSADSIKDTDKVSVSVEVTNTGSVAGKEIIQVYVHDQKCRLVRPVKELKGFAKVELKPGETKKVSIPLDFRSFAFYDPHYMLWATEDGEFDILVGASAADIRCKLSLTVKSTVELPCMLTNESSMAEWLADQTGSPVIAPLYQEILKVIRANSGDETMDVPDFLKREMPLKKALEFAESYLPTSPNEVVTGLLQAVGK